MLSLLSAAELALLDAALRPRRRLERDRGSLMTAFATCLTRSDFERAFSQWIEGADHAGTEDEIVLQDEKVARPGLGD